MKETSIKKNITPEKIAESQAQARKLLWEGFTLPSAQPLLSGPVANFFHLLKEHLNSSTEIFIPKDVQNKVFLNDTGSNFIPSILKKALTNIKNSFVVRPLSVKDIKKFLDLASEHRISFTIRGAGTWPFGGAVPLNGDVLVDLSQLKTIELDKKEGALYIGPGITFEEARNLLRKEGFALLQEITNPHSGTICGWIATGGQGLGCYKYGPVKESILDLEVITPLGEEKKLKPKDPEFSIFTGSEGQFGIITGVKLKVKEENYITKPYGFTFDTCKEAVGFIKKIKESALSPTSILYYDSPYIKEVYNIEKETLRLLQATYLEEKDRKRLSDIIQEEDELEELKNCSHVVIMEFDDLSDYQKALRTGFFDSSRKRPVFNQLSVTLAHKLWEHRYMPVQLKQKGPSMIVSENLLPLSSLEKYIEFCSDFVMTSMEVQVKTEAHILEDEKVLVQSILLADTAHIRHTTYFGLVPFFSQVAVSMGGSIYGTGIWNTPFMKIMDKSELQKLFEKKQELDPLSIINQGKFLNYRGRKLTHRAFSKYSQKLLEIAANIFESGSGDKFSWLIGTIFPRVVPAGSRVKRDPISDLTCVCAECDSCEKVCPTSDVFGTYGPATPIIRRKTADRIVKGEAITRDEALGFLVCTRCGNCDRACPTGVPLTKLYDMVEEHPSFKRALNLTDEEKEDFINRFWQIMKESPLYCSHTRSQQKDDKSHLQHGLKITYPRDFKYASLSIDKFTCIRCGMCSGENACTYGARVAHAREIPELLHEKCSLCNACINYCPMNMKAQEERILLDRYIYNAVDLEERKYWIKRKEKIFDTTVVIRSEMLTEVADVYVTEEIIMEIDKESSTGKITVSGMGQGDRHMGIGFDAERFSHFHIVGPAQNRLHEGDPEEELSITLGKRDPFCVFDNEGRIMNRKAPQLRLGSPFIYNVMQLESNGKAELALIKVAEKQNTIVIIDFPALLDYYPYFLSEGNYKSLPSVIVPRINHDIVHRLTIGPTVGRNFLNNLWHFPMFELTFHKGMAETLTYVKESAWQEAKNTPLISVYLQISEYDVIGEKTFTVEIQRKIDYLLKLKVDVIHVEGLKNRDNYFATSKAVRALHHYLLSIGKRFEVSIIASGGIRLASDTQKTIQRGAEATAMDFSALLALDPTSYQAIVSHKTSTEKLLGMEVEWAEERLNNQAESRKVQILEVLGAAGFKDIKKTVGEEGRLIDFNSLEERLQKNIFENTKILETYKELNKELIEREPEYDFRSYSDLKKILKPVPIPHHFYCLGDANQSLYSRDYVWPGGLIETMGKMASGDLSMVNLKNVRSTGNLGDGFDVMKLRYNREPEDIPEEELNSVSTALYLGKNLTLKAPWMFGGKSVGSVGLDTWRAQVIASRTLGIQVDTGEGGYPTSFFLDKKGGPIFFTEPEVQSIREYFEDDRWYKVREIEDILLKEGFEKGSDIFKKLDEYPKDSPILFKTVVAKEDEPYVSTELKTGLFGVKKETIKKARRVVIAYSQGAKMGIGGHILSQKVNRLVAYLRGIEGIEYIKEEILHKLLGLLNKLAKKEDHALKEYIPDFIKKLEKVAGSDEVTEELKKCLKDIQNRAYEAQNKKLIDPLEFQDLIRFSMETIDYSYTSIISPFPFHNCYSIEDVKAFIDIVRMINPETVVSIKVSPSIDIEFIAAGLARIAKDNTVDMVEQKIRAEVEEIENLTKKSAEWAKKYGMNIEVWLDGPRGGTGASPNIIKGQMGMHIEYAIPLIHYRLVKDGLRNYVKFFVSGGIRTYEDVIKAVALGADGVILGTAPMISIGCDRNRNCHDGCSRGIATSNLIMQKLRDIGRNTTQMLNAFSILQMQVIKSLAALGIKDIRELRGRFDLIHWMGLKERVDHRVRLRKEAALQLSRQKERDVPTPFIEESSPRPVGVSNCGVAAICGTEPVPSYIVHKTLYAMRNRGMDGVGLAKSLCFPDHSNEYAFMVLVKGVFQTEMEEIVREENKELKDEKVIRDKARNELIKEREKLADLIKALFLEPVFEIFPGKNGKAYERDLYRLDEKGAEGDYREFGADDTDPGDIFRFFVRVKKPALKEYIESQLLVEPQLSLWQILYPGINRENYRTHSTFLRKAEDSFVFNRSVLLSSMLYAYEISDDYRERFMCRELWDNSLWGQENKVKPDEFTERIKTDQLVKWGAEKEFFERYPYPWNKYRYKERERKIATVLSCGKNFACWKTAGREIPWETPAAPNNIIHVRLATGSMVEQMNAHPFAKLHTALTHNGETTNYEALKQRVEQFGHTPLAGTDTDVAALKFHLLADEWNYPDWALFESFSPTTGDDLLLLDENEREPLERVQKVEFTSSPDGPYQYLCLRHDPEKRVTERIDLKDPADLRPNVSLIWHDRRGERLKAFSIIASEEQAGRVMLDLMDKEGIIEGSEPDDAFVSSGMITRASFDEKSKVSWIDFIDRYGKPILLPDHGVHYSYTRNKDFSPKDKDEIEKVLKDRSNVRREIVKKLPEWEFNDYRYAVEKLVETASDRETVENTIEILTWFTDYLRTIDTGKKAVGSLKDITKHSINRLFDSIENIDGIPYKKTGFKGVISRPEDEDETLVVDGTGFLPEGIDAELVLAPFLSKAYDLGWRKFILYRVSGQRCISTAGFGKGDTDDVEIDVYGTPGEYLGAFMQGGTIRVHGSSQNFTAMVMHHGNIYVYGNAGKVCGYASKGGKVFIMGNVVDRAWTNSVNDPRCQDLDIRILGYATKYAGESLMGGDFFFGGLRFNEKGEVVTCTRPYLGTKLMGGASRGNFLFFDPAGKLLEFQYRHGVKTEITDDVWKKFKPRVLETFKEANIPVIEKNGESSIIVDGKETPLIPDKFVYIKPRGGLKGYESH